MKKIKILYIVPSLRICNGVASYAMNYFRQIDNSEIQIDFITGINEESIYYEEIKKKGSKIFYIPKIGLKNFFQVIKQIKEFFKTNKYDIVHCHVLNMGAFYLYYAKKYNIKARILHSHATKSADKILNRLRNNFFLPIAVKNANIYCACSKLAGDFMFKNKKYNVIKNAVNLEKFKYNESIREKIRKLENIRDDEYIIGNIGRFVHQKNQLFLIDIFIEYLKINPNSKLLLIGNGPLEKDIKKKINKNGITDKVIIRKNISNVNEYLQAMDIFLLPSIYEGLPVVGIEAQAAGLPCILSKNITTETDITDNCTFSPINENVGIWTNEIQKKQEQFIRKMDNSKIIKSGYEINEAVKELEEMYKNIMN